MKTATVAIILFSSALLWCRPASAQNTVNRTDSLYWESVLSSYGDFCRTASSARNGDKTAVARIRSQAATIKELLLQAKGGMTESQHQRFSAMRKEFSGISIPDLPTVTQTREPIKAPEPEQPAASQQKEAPPTAPAVQGSNTVYRDTVTFEKTIIHRDSVKIYNTVEKITEITTKVEEKATHRPLETIFALVRFSPAPDLSAGLMAGFVNKIGLYFNYVGNFSSAPTDYNCCSDGQTPFGYIWTSGAQKVSTFRATAGLCAKVTPWLMPYAGAGYGRRTLVWEDSAGQWARVTDCSFEGVAAEAGLLLNFDHVAFSVGVGTVAFGYCTLDFGLGYCF